MSSNLATALALLEVLRQPEHAQFNEALNRLTRLLEEGNLNPMEAGQLGAALEAVMGGLKGEQDKVAAELAKLRQGNQVLKAYGK